MRTLRFSLCSTDVTIAVGLGALEELRSLDGDTVVIYSASVSPEVFAEKLRGESLAVRVTDGESVKELSSVIAILETIASRAPQDFAWIVAVGGGTLLDVAGFIASIYRRGVSLANVPTTLLAMVDAAMGGKNGVNFAGVKNLIGTFYQPKLVISDTIFLETLPDYELSNGIAEVIKYCVTLDSELCNILVEERNRILARDHGVLEEVVYRSALNKMSIVSQDEREEKLVRIVLNFGHTIGHAIESGSGFRVPHGRAVAIGMVCESRIAEELGVAERGLSRVVEEMVKLYGLPSSVRELDVEVDVERAVRAVRRDKKRRGGVIHTPLPVRLGSWRRVELSVEDVEVYLRRCLS